jgi:hypothetical protein
MRGAGHVINVGERTGKYKVLVGMSIRRETIKRA